MIIGFAYQRLAIRVAWTVHPQRVFSNRSSLSTSAAIKTGIRKSHRPRPEGRYRNEQDTRKGYPTGNYQEHGSRHDVARFASERSSQKIKRDVPNWKLKSDAGKYERVRSGKESTVFGDRFSKPGARHSPVAKSRYPDSRVAHAKRGDAYAPSGRGRDGSRSALGGRFRNRDTEDSLRGSERLSARPQRDDFDRPGHRRTNENQPLHRSTPSRKFSEHYPDQAEKEVSKYHRDKPLRALPDRRYDNPRRGSALTEEIDHKEVSSPAASRRWQDDPHDMSSSSQTERRPKARPVISYTTPASEFLYGTSVVLEALRSDRRKLYKLYIMGDKTHVTSQQEQSLQKLALARGVRPTVVTSDWESAMDQKSHGRPHNVCIQSYNNRL